MPFHRILVPVDGTEASRSVLPYLPMLLESPESEVLLVRAVPFLATLLEMPNDFASGPPSMGSDISEGKAQVARLVVRLREFGIRARGLSQVGSPMDLIDHAIRKEKIDLIALSSGPTSEFWNVFWDTLPEHLLRHTTLPLFLLHVRPPVPHWTAQFPWRPRSGRVLVPMAGNPASVDAVGTALGLARRIGARITLEALPDADCSLAYTLEHLARGLKRCEREHVLAEKRMARGDPARVLLEEADLEAIDLIVLPPRLVPSPAADPLGSMVARLLRRVRVPLMFPGRSRPDRMKSFVAESLGSKGPSSPTVEKRRVAKHNGDS
ncbi:MAG TPA: universal stress protein [Planctomycetota bacterium]|nr:universal stress protein [Planctomycetota bacterium]